MYFSAVVLDDDLVLGVGLALRLDFAFGHASLSARFVLKVLPSGPMLLNRGDGNCQKFPSG